MSGVLAHGPYVGQRYSGVAGQHSPACPVSPSMLQQKVRSGESDLPESSGCERRPIRAFAAARSAETHVSSAQSRGKGDRTGFFKQPNFSVGLPSIDFVPEQR